MPAPPLRTPHSGETANGAHPFDAVRYMARTACEAESITNYAALFGAIRESTLSEVGQMTIPEAVASSAVKTAVDMGAKCIIVCSETGNSARLVAKYRPGAPILCLTATEDAARQVTGLCRGVHAVVMGSMIGTDSIIHRVRGGEGEVIVDGVTVLLCLYSSVQTHSIVGNCAVLSLFTHARPRFPFFPLPPSGVRAGEGLRLGCAWRLRGGGARNSGGPPWRHQPLPRAGDHLSSGGGGVACAALLERTTATLVQAG